MKILVVRFSSIGDIVLTSPVLRCLKEQLEAEIHYITKARYLPLLKSNPHIDRLIGMDKDIPEVMNELKIGGYDFILDLHHNLRTWRLKRQLGVPSSSFPKLNFKKWLLTFFKIDLMPDLHLVDRYFEAAGKLGIVNDGLGLEFFIPEDEEVDPPDLSHNLQVGKYLAIVIGGKFATKRLTTEKLIRICKQLKGPVLLLGGPADQKAADQIVDHCGENIVHFCGKLSINQSASLIRQSRLVMTHDTGLMHIAAAFRKKIILIWGNTVPEFGMGPYYGDNPGFVSEFQINGLGCRPCSKLGYEKCPKGHFKCMEGHSAEEILLRLE